MHVRDLRLLTYFVAVAEAMSVRGAARRLHVSAPVVSKALSDLENALGATLVDRGARRLALTAAGKRVLGEATAMLEAAERAMGGLPADPEDPSGTLSLTVPTELCLAWLPPVLERFEARYPKVALRLSASDRRVALAGSEFDLAIRGVFCNEPRAGDDALDHIPLTLVCSPRRLGRRSSPLADKLARIPFIGFAREHAAPPMIQDARTGVWQLLEMESRFFVDNAHVAKSLAVLGFGAALVMTAAAREDLEAGRLVPVSRGHRYGYVALFLEQRDRLPTPAARAFVTFVERGYSAAAGARRSDA